VNSIWEQKVEVARAKRLARAREFAAQRGLSRQAGEHLAAAVDAEPGLNLSLVDQFPPGMREAVAAILPRAAYGLGWPPPRGGAVAGRGGPGGRPR
jgi:phytoene dehydrogenase-like protein